MTINTNIKRMARLSLTILSSLLIATQLISMQAFAQEDNQATADDSGGSGLQVSPGTVKDELIPGQVKTFQFNVSNPTASLLRVTPVVYDFTSDNTTGRPVLNVDPEAINSRSIKNYISGLDVVDLESGDSYQYNLEIVFPDEVIPGAYYGAVAFQATPLNTEGEVEGVGVAINANVAPLILIDVLGEASTNGLIKDAYAATIIDQNLQTTLNNVNSGSIFSSLPDVIAVNIENTGDTFLEPLGTVTIKGMFGSETTYNFNGGLVKGNILPESERTFIDQIPEDLGGLKIGRFTVEGGIGLVDGGEVREFSFTFWVIPSWLWGLLIGLMALIAGGVYLIVRRIRG